MTDEQLDISSVLESFSGLVPRDEAKIERSTATQEQIIELMDKCIYGLLSQDTITTPQINLLTALLQARY